MFFALFSRRGSFPAAAPWIAVLLLMGFATFRIVRTYPILNQTWDEPAHIAAGMELLARGTYRYDPQHTPLARVLVAAGPYLASAGFHDYPDMYVEGNAILAANGNYWRNLTLARLGVLPFFFLAVLTTFVLARRVFGVPAAIVAVAILCSFPPLIGHAGLATTDIAATGTFTAAVFLFLRWRDQPDMRNTIGLALSCTAAMLARLSVVPMLAIAFAAILFLRPRMQAKPSRRAIAAAFACAVILISASYRFAITPVLDPAEAARAQALHFGFHGSEAFQRFEFQAVALPVPASPFLRGLYRTYEHLSKGHPSYLLGQYRETGWWYYFLVEIVFRTPIGFLFLSAAGIWLILRHPDNWQAKALLITSASVLLVCSLSSIDLGIRHLLPLYPILAAVAGFAVTELWKHRAGRIFAAAMVLWCVVAGVRAHPDSLAYFNEFAGDHPERILTGSDLDWGQDLHRLAARLRELNVGQVKLKYSGTADIALAGLPPYQILKPGVPEHGYIAISVRYLTLDDARAKARSQARGPYSWLLDYTPVERIGASILLYKL